MKICFWGNIAEALIGNTSGGAELQIAMLAQILARGGNEIVVLDFETDKDFITSEGIKVFKIPGWNAGIKVLRTFTHRLPNLYHLLKYQKADIYYCRIRDFRHFLAFLAARKVHGKFVLAMASDLDAMSLFQRMRYTGVASLSDLWGLVNGLLVEVFYPVMLRKADLVLVQHDGQKKILLQRAIQSTVFYNLIDLSKVKTDTQDIPKDFIYIGWLDRRKGFKQFYNLITKSTAHSFIIIGPPRDKTGQKYFKKLSSFPNVSLLGRLSHDDTIRYLKDSLALISTSPMEGFPNTFIEAWACGIPVLSLYVDPGDVIKREGLGEVMDGDIDKLLIAMNTFRPSDEFSKRTKAYINNYHCLNEKKIKEVNKLFSDLLEDNIVK